MNEIISGRNPCGILTFYLNPERKEIYEKVQFNETQNYVKFWGKDENDKMRKWAYLPSDFSYDGEKIKINSSNEKLYKVIWPKSGANANWRYTKILKPKEYFTDTFINVYLNSEEQCNNFIFFFKTLFYRFCEVKTATDHNAYRVVHSNIPNLKNIKNPRTDKIGWDSDWNEDDLKKLFTFITEDEWKYIEEEALKSDKGRK